MGWDGMVTGQCADDVLTTDLHCCHCLCVVCIEICNVAALMAIE